MSIDWGALALVAVVSLVTTVAIVSLAATAARLLDEGRARRQAGGGTGVVLVGAYALLGLVALIVLFGLYLLIPYLH